MMILMKHLDHDSIQKEPFEFDRYEENSEAHKATKKRIKANNSKFSNSLEIV